MQNRCCVNGCFFNSNINAHHTNINLNNSAQLYFSGSIYCLHRKLKRGLKFHFGQIKQSEICTEASFTLVAYNNQKQPPRGVPRKNCSENVQQITGENPCRSAISIKMLCFATLLKSHFGMGVLM